MVPGKSIDHTGGVVVVERRFSGSPRWITRSGMSDRMHVRTLIADNSRAFLAGARRWIAECPGLDLVGTVHRGNEVLETVERLNPDLVLMDVILPEIDGLEATRRIKSRQGAPWVVIATFEQGSPLREAARPPNGSRVLRTVVCYTS